jgi:thioredoxin reductase
MPDQAVPVDHDVLVVGGGPAGLAAALWAARYRRRVLVLDKGETRNRWVEESHGYLGSDGIGPSELLERARADLRQYPTVTVRPECEVFAGRATEEGFVLELADGSEVAGLRLVIATGVRDVFPDVENFFDHYGASVFHCPTCDGYEAAEKDIVVFGWSENVVGFALGLFDWARSITIVTDGRAFEGEEHHREVLERHRITLIEDEATAFVGDRGDLRAVRLKRTGDVPCQLAFFSIAHQPASGLARQLGCATTEGGCIQVDDNAETTVQGVYAAGDLTPGMQLIQVAAAKGRSPASPPRSRCAARRGAAVADAGAGPGAELGGGSRRNRRHDALRAPARSRRPPKKARPRREEGAPRAVAAREAAAPATATRHSQAAQVPVDARLRRDARAVGRAPPAASPTGGSAS